MDFVSGAIALSLVGGGTAVAVAMPNLGSDCTTRYELKESGLVERTYCDGALTKTRPAQLVDKPAKGTGGLVIRDENGVNTGSGIGEGQSFIFIKCGPKGSGLIDVFQLDSADDEGITGGWGTLYTGFVKKKFTQNPSAYPCN